jgi:serine protease
MNKKSIKSFIALFVVAGSLAVPAISGMGILLDSGTTRTAEPTAHEEAIVRELTVRYLPGVSEVDDEGYPNGTRHIDGIEFSQGNTYPNGILGLKVDPALTSSRAFEVAANIRKTGMVEFADPMFPLRADTESSQWQTCVSTGGTNDPCVAKQAWYLDAINASAGWNDSSANTPFAVVAVVDTGQLNHPDIQANLLPGRDFIKRSFNVNTLTEERVYSDGFESSGDGDEVDADPTDMGQGRNDGQCRTNSAVYNLLQPTFNPAPARDSNWHGTAVASIIAAPRNNSTGIAGVAPAVKIVPVRVLGRCIETDDPSNLVDGIYWAAGVTVGGNTNANPAHVINLSLGSDTGIVDYCPTVYEEAINAAVARGSIVVASAGNASKPSREHTPSNCPNVISVGASNSSNVLARYSNINADISAPGGQLESGDFSGGILFASNTETRSLTTPVYQYKFGQGTSYSAPLVSAMIAMARTKFRTTDDVARLAPAKMKEAVEYAASLGVKCNQCGSGILTLSNLLSVVDPQAVPTFARSVTVQGGPNTTSQGLVSWNSPRSHQWNPITSYVARAYANPIGGSPVSTCSPESLAQLTCAFNGLEENTTYYASVVSTAANSGETPRSSFTTYRRAAAPTAVTATPGRGKVSLSWTQITDFGDFNGFGLYEVVAYSSAVGGSAVGTCYGGDSCDIDNLTGGVTYWFEVSAMTNQHPGGSMTSTRVSATPTAIANSSPSGNVPSSNNGNTPAIQQPAGSPAVNTPGATPAVPTATSRVGRSLTSTTLLRAAKAKAVKGSTISYSINRDDRRNCQVSGKVIRAIRKGTCRVTITQKPKRGQSIRSTVMVRIS